MSKSKTKLREKVYYVSPNGIKWELIPFIQDKMRDELVTELRISRSMLVPVYKEKKLEDNRESDD